MLHLGIALGVMCNIVQLFSAQVNRDCRENVEHKLRSVIDQRLGLSLVRDDPVFHKNDCSIRQGYCDDG